MKVQSTNGICGWYYKVAQHWCDVAIIKIITHISKVVLWLTHFKFVSNKSCSCSIASSISPTNLISTSVRDLLIPSNCWRNFVHPTFNLSHGFNLPAVIRRRCHRTGRSCSVPAAARNLWDPIQLFSPVANAVGGGRKRSRRRRIGDIRRRREEGEGGALLICRGGSEGSSRWWKWCGGRKKSGGGGGSGGGSDGAARCGEPGFV